MNRAGHQLLAGATLADDQHRGRRRGDFPHQRQHALHDRAAADDRLAVRYAVQFPAEPLVFRRYRGSSNCRFDPSSRKAFRYGRSERVRLWQQKSYRQFLRQREWCSR